MKPTDSIPHNPNLQTVVTPQQTEGSNESLHLLMPAYVKRDSAGNIERDSLGHIQFLESYSDSLTLDDALGRTCMVIQPTDAMHMETAPEAASHDWHQGRIGEERIITIGHNSGVLTVISCIFILMMLGYKQCKRLFSTLGQQLWGMRRRANVFDTHTTNEARYLILMIVQWCIFTGLLLYSAISIGSTDPHIMLQADLPPQKAFAQTAMLMGLMAIYFIVQYVIYQMLGYTFTDGSGRKLLIKGFEASQSILGFFLIIPSLVAIFYQNATYVCVIVGILFYFIARIIFIIKGFRIFYTNFSSLFYFILYLCTLEIIPLILLCQIALFLVNSL